ncbi:MAG: type II secretion system protein M [Phycisphaerales bacterium]|nr:MAG: type II secretion system protein M [Phycisphaerales bacterium]
MKPIYRKYLRAGAVFWAVCFIALFLFYLIVLGPQEQVRSRTESRLAQAQAQAQAATEAAQEKTKARLMEQVQEAGDTLERFVIDEKLTDSLTLDIREIPGREALSAFGISAGGEALIQMNNCRHIFGKRLSVNFTSSFNEFAAFLNALERNRPVIFIDTFSITRARDGTSEHEVDMALAVLVEKQAGAEEG